MQQAEFVVEQERDLARAEHASAGGCELDGQRHAVELSDQVGDVDDGVVVEFGQRPRPLRAIDEQLHRRRGPRMVRVVIHRHGEGTHHDHPFLGEPQRDAGGDQHPGRAVGLDERSGELRCPGERWFAVVEHDQTCPVDRAIAERIDRGETRVAGHDVGDVVLCRGSRQRGEEDVAVERALFRERELAGEPRLADPSWAYERDQPVLHHQVVEQIQLARATQKRRMRAHSSRVWHRLTGTISTHSPGRLQATMRTAVHARQHVRHQRNHPARRLGPPRRRGLPQCHLDAPRRARQADELSSRPQRWARQGSARCRQNRSPRSATRSCGPRSPRSPFPTSASSATGTVTARTWTTRKASPGWRN